MKSDWKQMTLSDVVDIQCIIKANVRVSTLITIF